MENTKIKRFTTPINGSIILAGINDKDQVINLITKELLFTDNIVDGEYEFIIEEMIDKSFHPLPRNGGLIVGRFYKQGSWLRFLRRL